MGVMYDVILRRLRVEDEEEQTGFAKIEDTPQFIIVSDITSLTISQIASLRVGDEVIVKTNNGDYCFSVSYADNVKIRLVHYDWRYNTILVVKYSKVNGYTATSIIDLSVKVNDYQPVGGMLPNKLYDLGELSQDTIFQMAAASDNTIENKWHWIFSIGANVPNITWPNEITIWNGGSAPTIAANKHYEVVVIGGFAVCFSDLASGETYSGIREVLFVGSNGKPTTSAKFKYTSSNNGTLLIGNGSTIEGTALTLSDNQCDIGTKLNVLEDADFAYPVTLEDHVDAYEGLNIGYSGYSKGITLYDKNNPNVGYIVQVENGQLTCTQV